MSDLRKIHVSEETGAGKRGKVIGAAIVAVAICALGVYTYQAGMWNAPSGQAGPALDLPSPTPPQPRIEARTAAPGVPGASR